MKDDRMSDKSDSESQVWNAIAVFEQILQTLPNDRVSLEALSHAYEQVGDAAKAREYFLRLAGIVLEEKDLDAARQLSENLRRYDDGDPAVSEMQRRIRESLRQTPSPVAPGPETSARQGKAQERAGVTEDLKRQKANIAAELSFAWALYQAGELTQEEYATVAQDLTEVSMAPGGVTISTLHALQDRNSASLERAICFAARERGTPVLPLQFFEVQEKTAQLLPLEYMIRNGVMVFDLIGNEALVAIMNPFNTSLMEEVEARLRRKCHFYLALPADFDAVIGQIKSKVEGAAPSVSG